MRGMLYFENPIADAISRVRFAPSSDNLLISSWDSRLRLFDVSGSVLRLDFHGDVQLLDCCFQDESVAYAAGSDGSVYRYDLQSATCASVGSHDDSATCVEFSQESGQLITAGWDRKLVYWDLRSSKILGHQTVDVESISLYGCHLFVASGNSVNTYDLRMSDVPVEVKTSSLGVQIRCISSTPHIKGFAVGSVDGRVALEFPYSSNTEKKGYAFRCLPKLKNGKNHHVAVNNITFNPVIHGAFVTGDYEGHVIGWDAQSRKRLFELPKYPNSVASLSYNYTGELLAVASSHSYREATEREDPPPQVFIQETDSSLWRSSSAGSSCKR
ncbi:hypothetical protein V2J09_003759 [Rumex salicifolius]